MLPHPQIILVPAHLPGKSDLLHVEVGPNLSTLASPSTHWDPYTRGGKWSVSMENRWALGGQRSQGRHRWEGWADHLDEEGGESKLTQALPVFTWCVHIF